MIAEKKIALKEPPKTLEDEVVDLKLKLASMTEMFYMLRKMFQKSKDRVAENTTTTENGIYNKDGIPINSSFIGFTKKSPYPYILTVGEDGIYRVGKHKFKSLSSAAEFVSGVRRSGWTFWKLMDGRTLKEVYKTK